MLLRKGQLYVAEVAATEEGRYALDCVLVHPDGTVVATDSALLMVVEGGIEDTALEAFPASVKHSELEAPVLLPAETIKQSLKGWPKSKGYHTHVCQTYVALNKRGVELSLTTIGDGLEKKHKTAADEGAFPKDWRDIITPSKHTKARFTVGASLLLQLVQAMQKAKGVSDSDSITFDIVSRQEPLVLRCQDIEGHAIIGVISPVLPSDDVSDDPLGKSPETEWETNLHSATKDKKGDSA